MNYRSFDIKLYFFTSRGQRVNVTPGETHLTPMPLPQTSGCQLIKRNNSLKNSEITLLPLIPLTGDFFFIGKQNKYIKGAN